MNWTYLQSTKTSTIIFQRLPVMIKSALPATIAIAAIQSDVWAEHFSVLNYLVAIEALLTFCVLPRARFLQTLFLNVLLVCVATAVNLLALWCSVQARKHTAHPEDEYNSSASAVCAVWFFIQMYLTNALRSSRPQFQFPCINYCILAIIALTQAGPSFRTMDEVNEFMWLQLQAFLTGFGLGTGVSLFIFPHSNREIVLGSIGSYFTALSKLLSAYESLIEPHTVENPSTSSQNGAAFGSYFDALKTIYIKLKMDIKFGVRDIGFGILDGTNLNECVQLLYATYLPLMGLRDVVDDDGGADHASNDCTCKESTGASNNAKMFRPDISKKSKDIVLVMVKVLDSLKGRLLPTKGATSRWLRTTRKKDHDPEKDNNEIVDLASRRTELIFLAESLLRESRTSESVGSDPEFIACGNCTRRLREARSTEQQTQFILWHLSKAIIEILEFVEAKSDATKLNHRRVILPTREVLVEWFFDMFAVPDSLSSVSISDPGIDSDGQAIFETALYGRDPLHRAPETLLERIGDGFRSIPHMLRSPHSLFGLRAACASMTIGIIAFLESSRMFYVKQRCLWAIVMTAFAMVNTTGHTLFSFGCRILASLVGTAGSYCIWYIADGNPAGVTVLMFLFMAGCFYCFAVNPKYALLSLVSAVTPIIGVGYELNVKKLGEDYLSAFNTPAFPLYQITAYRLLNVVAGLFAAYIWTIFPFPITEGALIQQHVGACLYLLARYNAMVSETLLSQKRVCLSAALVNDLKQARLSVLQQVQALVAKLKTYSTFTGWQIPMGGRFPVEEYRDCIVLLEHLSVRMAFQGYAISQMSVGHHETEAAKMLLSSLESLASSHHRVTSALCLLSASITNGLPLPPYLLGEDYVDGKIQGLEQVLPSSSSPESQAPVEELADFKALAVLHSVTHKVDGDLRLLLRKVRILCGELDFSLSSFVTASDPERGERNGPSLGA